MNPSFNVGGVELARPFKFRRLNHVILYYESSFKDIARFYIGLLGLRMTDCIYSGMSSGRGPMPYTLDRPFAFSTISSIDHHNIGFMPSSGRQNSGHLGSQSGTMVNHFAWDIGSFEETRAFLKYVRENNVKIWAVTQRMPGSNISVYYYDPEGNLQHTNWNIESLGWRYTSKPGALWTVMGFNRGPDGEYDETTLPDSELTNQAMAKLEGSGKSLDAHSLDAYRDLLDGIMKEYAGRRYNVHGVVLPRPYSLAKLSNLTLGVDDLDMMSKWYTERMGLRVSDSTEGTVYLRHGSDHHSLVLRSSDSEHVVNRKSRKLLSLSIQVRTYQELLNSAVHLKDHGVEILSKGRSFPGGEYYVDFMGPEEQPLRLAFYMEKIGWEGKSRPPNTWRPLDQLPDRAETASDVYDEEIPSTFNVY